MRSFTDRALQPEIRVGHWRNVRMSPSRNLEIELSETILGRGLKLHPSHDHKLEERESCCCEGKTQEIRVETASTSSVSRSLPLCLCVRATLFHPSLGNGKWTDKWQEQLFLPSSIILLFSRLLAFPMPSAHFKTRFVNILEVWQSRRPPL